jgi:competence protein ComEC
VTTLVAGFATSPFAAFHFERVATYSLLGNLLAAPLVSAIIMPFGLLSLVVMPFGLEALPLAVMAWGIEMLLGVARFVASIPGAQVRAPPIAAVCLLLIAGGMVWMCLCRRRWRLFGLAPIVLGLLLIPAFFDPPDIFIAPSGTAIAMRDSGGVLRVSGARAGSYVVAQFFDEEGGAPSDVTALRLGVHCDATACLLRDRTGNLVSHVRDPSAFVEDCRHAAVVLTGLTAPADCHARLVIDAPQLARFGAHAVWLSNEEGPTFNIEMDRSATPRPWKAGVDPLP